VQWIEIQSARRRVYGAYPVPPVVAIWLVNNERYPVIQKAEAIFVKEVATDVGDAFDAPKDSVEGAKRVPSARNLEGVKRAVVAKERICLHGTSNEEVERPSAAAVQTPVLYRSRPLKPIVRLLLSTSTPLPLAGNAVSISVHLHIRAVRQEVLGLSAGFHLRAVGAAVAGVLGTRP
jgi:hypothetical protein